jgi:ribosomal protein S21
LRVFVRDNNVDQALRVLKKKMQREGVFREMKRRKARKQAQREGLIPHAQTPGRCAPSGAAAKVVLSLLRTSRDALGRGHKMPADRTRRTTTSREAAEAAFKAATTKPAELPPKRPTIPNAKELVSLRIDRNILDHFQEAGPGWQDRINEALRKVVGK